MAPKKIIVKSYQTLKDELHNLSDHHSDIYILFSGSKDEQGKNWCPDCVKAEPFINEHVEKLAKEVVLIYCEVGQRTEWKNPKNPFRLDENFQISSVPTLLKWTSPKRLSEDECCDPRLLEIFFEDD